ncbi:hypothetical protein BLL40_03815 [Domibacillus mangrovi]|uniref:Uncharacterized protein n=1 Tax=Domibacillus mangrovi TaxID=1714354 RepID=A0A1Q5P5E7_9BACI|nr:hypothetical protein BLL40_03815 [Domibacillus mangrovi]
MSRIYLYIEDRIFLVFGLGLLCLWWTNGSNERSGGYGPPAKSWEISSKQEDTLRGKKTASESTSVICISESASLPVPFFLLKTWVCTLMNRPGVDGFLTFKKGPHRDVCVQRLVNI